MKRRFFITLMLATLLFGMVAPFIRPLTASADPQSDIKNVKLTFQDRATIVADLGSYGKIDFVDNNINDSDRNYAPVSGNFCDKHGIDLKSGGSLNWSASQILAHTVELGYQTGNRCNTVTVNNIWVNNPTDSTTGQPAAAARFQWDGSNITTLNGQSSVATLTPGQNSDGVYIEQTDNNSSCHAYAAIALNSGSTNTGTLYLFDGSQDGYTSIPGLGDISSAVNTESVSSTPLSKDFDSSCNVLTDSGFAPHTVYITGTRGNAAPGGGGAGGGAASGSTSVGCNFGDGSFGNIVSLINPINWLICGVIEGLSAIISFLDSAIVSQLTVNTNSIFCTNGNGQCADYHKAWMSFRDIALGLMLIIGLIILISQALGFEILDAYAIRKALPRLLLAALAIVLSWQLMDFFVTLSNDLGYSVRHLIEGPFCDIGNCSVSINPFTFWNNFAVPAIFGIGSFGILTLVGAAALAVLVAWIVLVLRQILIIFMVIIAPVAIIAYVLPNTNRAYKLWWESFSKALLMFPLIAAFIAAGHVFALIANQDTNSTINQTVAFFAYFAPYFMLPMTFRMAGSALGGLGNLVNSRAQPGYAKLSEARRKNTTARLARARGGKLWRENWGTLGGRLGYTKTVGADGKEYRRPRSIGRYANRMALWALDSDEKIPHLIGTKGGRVGKMLAGNYALSSADQIDNETWGHVSQAAQTMQSKGPLHHKAEKALAGTWAEGEGQFSPAVMSRVMASRDQGGLGLTEGEAPQSAEDIVKMAQFMREYGSTDERSAASDLEAAGGFLANIHKNPEMWRAGDNIQAIGGFMLASSGRLDPDGKATVLNHMSHNPRQGPGLAARFEKHSAAASRQRAEMSHGKDVYQTEDGIYHSTFAGDNADAWDGVQWQKAKDNVLTQKLPDLYNSKGETVKNDAKVWMRMLKSGPEGGYDNKGTPLWSNEQEMARSQVFQLASQYSSSDPAAKKEALDFIDKIKVPKDERGRSYDMRDEFNNRERRYWDPRLRGEGPPTDEG